MASNPGLGVHSGDNKLLEVLGNRNKRTIDQDIPGIDTVDMVHIYDV
jgi:hypothetical protein